MAGQKSLSVSSLVYKELFKIPEIFAYILLALAALMFICYDVRGHPFRRHWSVSVLLQRACAHFSTRKISQGQPMIEIYDAATWFRGDYLTSHFLKFSIHHLQHWKADYFTLRNSDRLWFLLYIFPHIRRYATLCTKWIVIGSANWKWAWLSVANNVQALNIQPSSVRIQDFVGITVFVGSRTVASILNTLFSP